MTLWPTPWPFHAGEGRLGHPVQMTRKGECSGHQKQRMCVRGDRPGPPLGNDGRASSLHGGLTSAHKARGWSPRGGGCQTRHDGGGKSGQARQRAHAR